uniref:NYN domain-containing protein n=1 Tax=Panagrolaimus sp. PS1159 TaxID=55785 RepID=A0AC35GPM5_9BILA
MQKSKILPSLSNHYNPEDDPTGCPEKCWVFIDNSNLIIEGQKFFARDQTLLVPADPRARVDMGLLCDHVINRRSTGRFRAWLFGSGPPANDTLWEAIRKKSIDVHVSSRKTVSRKEKNVDTKLVFLATCEACSNEDIGGIFIFISGDRDYLDTIKGIIKMGFTFEVYTWKKSML